MSSKAETSFQHKNLHSHTVIQKKKKKEPRSVLSAPPLFYFFEATYYVIYTSMYFNMYVYICISPSKA